MNSYLSTSMKCLGILLCLIIGAVAQASMPLEQLPRLTSYWEDPAQKEVFVLAGERYLLRVGTHPARILTLNVDGREVLGDTGLAPFAVDVAGQLYVPAPREVVPDWEVHTGQRMQKAKSSAARMNVWRASPYYWQVHLLDIPFVPEPRAGVEAAVPIRGKLVFHLYADRVHLQIDLDPTHEQGVVTAGMSGQHCTGEQKLAGAAAALLSESCAVLSGGGGLAEKWSQPLSVEGSAWWVIRPRAGEPLQELFAPELEPINNGQVTIEGGHWLGYDRASGLYRIQIAANRGAFAFEPAWKIPTRRMEAAVRIADGGLSRPVVFESATGMGNLEAAAVTDPYGFPLPYAPFVCKNFSGEKEEPDDSAFGDIYFELPLQSGSATEFRIVPLFQTWGNHMLKQVSSIRFFNVYWHLSTGVSETTCFTHAAMKLGGVFVNVPDFRPFSGPFIMGQPQHDCLSWPGFLQYQSDDGEVKLLYQDTVFHSVSPNLARFTMRFRSSDNAARVSAEIIEIPQGDEARTFVRLRYDWDRAVQVKDDARLNFRWLNVYEKSLPRQLVWLDADERPQVREITTPDEAMLLGVALARGGAFIGTHGQKKDFSSLLLVRSFRAVLGGVQMDQVHATARFGKDNGSYRLTSPSAELKLQPGDYIEAELMLMPHAAVTTPTHKPLWEREHWVTRPPQVSAVTVGEKVSDFPASVRAQDDVAAFTVTGGTDTTVFTAGGFSAPVLPLLWKDGTWQDQQVHGGDGYQVDRDEDGTYRFTFVYPIRGTEAHKVLVTLAHCTEPIARARDSNGYLVLEAARAAGFTVKSPAIFAPGENEVRAGAAINTFRGESQAIRQEPLRVEIASGSTVIDVQRFTPEDIRITASGDAHRLHVRDLHPEGGYGATLNDAVQAATGEGGGMTLDVPAGDSRIEITRTKR